MTTSSTSATWWISPTRRDNFSAIATEMRTTTTKLSSTRSAPVHLVQTIGEAARHVSPEGRAAHSEIPWHRIVGMRHRIVHDYLNVDTDIVWEVVSGDLAPLISALAEDHPDVRSG